MNICLVEPFFSGSHQQWAEALQRHSSHQFTILSLAGRHWKWRMHGAAINLAKQLKELPEVPDLILASDMLDLNLFLSLSRKMSSQIPVAMYFHENQLTYPWSPQDRDVKHKRDNHYAFINYSSALSADKVFFNSSYHLNSFLGALPKFLKQFPDKRNQYTVDEISAKSEVLNLGLDLTKFDAFKPELANEDKFGTILWNHRWEYDKAPDVFFRVLKNLKERGVKFHLAVLGERAEMYPKIFDEAKALFKDEIIHWGYSESFEDYAKALWHADILPISSIQDFFGGSIVEAMYCNCIPLLPKRLAYPGHIPEAYHQSYFYDDEEHMTNRLQRLLFNLKLTRKQNVQQFVSHYDWQACISDYDKAFEGLL